MLEPREYVGVDIAKGPGVDVVCKAENLVERFGKESFDAVISTCTLEHIRDWRAAVSNLKNVCKGGGLLFIVAPSIWPYHQSPCDFWRYSKEDIKNIFSDCEILSLEEDPRTPSLVYAKIKKPNKFMENDLSNYELYSIVLGKRVREIRNEDLNNYHLKILLFKKKVIGAVLKLGKFLIRKV
jgi:SAM-dependent methyltransferase